LIVSLSTSELSLDGKHLDILEMKKKVCIQLFIAHKNFQFDSS
jgi:hypothetical protein